MTWAEWYFYSEGLRKTQLKQWEHTRSISWMLYKVNSDPSKSKTNMLSWWPLPTDQRVVKSRKKGKRLTKEQFRAFVERMR